MSELSRNNDRAWFEAHRADYQNAILTPAQAFVEALKPRLREIDPKIVAIPKERGSIKGVERRQRFPADRRPPYREYLDLWFWAGRRHMWENSGFFLRLSATRLVLASGMIEFQKDALARYRNQVVDEARGTSLASTIENVRSHGYVIGGESYKRVPRGFPKAHPRANLLKHSGLFANLDVAHPAELTTPTFVDFVATHFARMAPLHRWLVGLRA